MPGQLRNRTTPPTRPRLHPDQNGLRLFSPPAIGVGIYVAVALVP